MTGQTISWQEQVKGTCWPISWWWIWQGSTKTIGHDCQHVHTPVLNRTASNEWGMSSAKKYLSNHFAISWVMFFLLNLVSGKISRLDIRKVIRYRKCWEPSLFCLVENNIRHFDRINCVAGCANPKWWDEMFWIRQANSKTFSQKNILGGAFWCRRVQLNQVLKWCRSAHANSSGALISKWWLYTIVQCLHPLHFEITCIRSNPAKLCTKCVNYWLFDYVYSFCNQILLIYWYSPCVQAVSDSFFT